MDKNPEDLAIALEDLILSKDKRIQLQERLQKTNLPFDIKTNLENIENSILDAYHRKLKA